jgi:hypothetical protein
MISLNVCLIATMDEKNFILQTILYKTMNRK